MINMVGEVTAEPWMGDAACRTIEPELFFPARGEQIADARAVCEQCSVRKACLEFALTHKIAYGVWGGKSERERRPMRGQRQRSRA